MEKNSEYPKIGIVILNWNNWQDTHHCVQNLREVIYPKSQLEIHAVDNGSGDDSPERLKEIRDITLHLSTTNKGFAGGNNIAIITALKQGCEYILLLNNDTQIPSNLLTGLISGFFESSDIGIVCPKILLSDEPKIIQFAGATYRLPRIIGELIGYGEIDTGQYNQIKIIDIAIGTCMLIKRDVFETIGLLDPDYFFYNEDIDFSYRTNNAGYHICYQPQVEVIHKNAQSTANNPELRTFLMAESRVIFFCKHIQGINSIPVFVLEGLRFLRLALQNLVLMKNRETMSYLRGVFSGLRIGFKAGRTVNR